MLDQTFVHPVNPDLHFRDIETIFTELRGDLSHCGSGNLQAKLNGRMANFYKPSHAAAKQQVIQLREFIESCGLDPERDYPL